MTNRDGKLLLALGRVEQSEQVHTRNMQEEEPKHKGKKGTYKRRDMRAEDQSTKDESGDE
jgi:hypothetical protein